MTPPPSRSRARRQTAKLAKRLISATIAAPEDLDAFARVLAERALMAACSPGRSIAKTVEHHLPGPGIEGLRTEVRRRANDIYDELRRPTLGPDLIDPEWFPLSVAARRLNLTETELLRRLVWPQWRRMYHWPRCQDGVRDWYFHAAAFSSAEMPAVQEPYHLLPSHCLRADQVDMSTAPQDL